MCLDGSAIRTLCTLANNLLTASILALSRSTATTLAAVATVPLWFTTTPLPWRIGSR